MNLCKVCEGLLNPYVIEEAALGSDVVDDMKMMERDSGKKDVQAG